MEAITIPFYAMASQASAFWWLRHQISILRLYL